MHICHNYSHKLDRACTLPAVTSLRLLHHQQTQLPPTNFQHAIGRVGCLGCHSFRAPCYGPPSHSPCLCSPGIPLGPGSPHPRPHTLPSHRQSALLPSSSSIAHTAAGGFKPSRCARCHRSKRDTPMQGPYCMSISNRRRASSRCSAADGEERATPGGREGRVEDREGFQTRRRSDMRNNEHVKNLMHFSDTVRPHHQMFSTWHIGN